jgi:hypothetical protein
VDKARKGIKINIFIEGAAKLLAQDIDSLLIILAADAVWLALSFLR